MKTAATILAVLFLSAQVGAQTTGSETEKIATFCKIWGFLKYYHPVVATGTIDWDKEFMIRIKALPALHSKQESSRYYTEWIERLGAIKNCKNCNREIPDSLKFNFDLTWLSDSSVFTSELIDQLKHIQQNRNQGKNYYVQQNIAVGNTLYGNEKPYTDSIYPSLPLRMLGLSRYWNTIEYFFPYKYRMDEDWGMVLREMIPKFMDARDTVSYHLAMLELTAKTNDSHAGFVSRYTTQYFGLKWPPFNFKIIDGQVVVTGFYNDSLCRLNDIRQGDVFLKVEQLSIAEIIRGKLKYIAASNDVTKLRNCSYAVFNGQTDSVEVTFERNGQISQKIIYRYPFPELNYDWQAHQPWLYKILDSNIGYVNLGLLEPEQVNTVMEKLRNTRAIIFDVRNYPKGTVYQLAYFLNVHRVPFVQFTKPDLSYPGVYHYTQAQHCGPKKNKHPYPGKTVLLFNERSQSQAEFTLMALQTAPRVISVGSQTAGADGNVSVITFPGNIKTYMTGIGVYYPDGRETQRVGIVPDVEVKPTIAGIKAGKDEVLEKALEILTRQ